MAAVLPRFVVLYSKSMGYYLRHGNPTGLLAIAVNAGKAWSPQAKFEVEQSKVHPSMVHIRCSYNNKYLRQYDTALPWMSPMAHEPNESLTDWASTLFQPEPVDAGGDTNTVVVRLLHVQLGRYVRCRGTTPSYSVLSAEGTDPADPTVQFHVTDWEALLSLPKHLAFKGDNGSFLGLLQEDRALRFEVDDRGDKSVANEVVALSDGTSFRIKNVSLGAFWRLNAAADGQIWADDDQTATTPPNPDSVFEAIKVSEDTIALRSLGNNMLCNRDEVGNFLKAAGESQTITQYAKLSVAELVTSRRIKDIDFQLDDGWVYNETPGGYVVLNHGEPVANESDTTRTMKVEIHYKDIKSCIWRSSTSSTLKNLEPKIVVEIQPDEIVAINDSSARFEMTTPFTPSYVWRETTTVEPNQVMVHEVTLPPWSVVTVRLAARVATCDVPFSYTRYDVLDGGEEEVHYMEDGLYTGTNYFSFTFGDSAPMPI